MKTKNEMSTTCECCGRELKPEQVVWVTIKNDKYAIAVGDEAAVPYGKTCFKRLKVHKD